MLERRHQSIPSSGGTSLLEILIVVAIILIVMAFALPVVFNTIETSKVREAGTDYSNLLQIARMRAVTDDRYYSVYIQAAQGNNPQLAYVGIYPQNVNGASGSGSPASGGSYTAGPPRTRWSPCRAK